MIALIGIMFSIMIIFIAASADHSEAPPKFEAEINKRFSEKLRSINVQKFEYKYSSGKIRAYSKEEDDWFGTQLFSVDFDCANSGYQIDSFNLVWNGTSYDLDYSPDKSKRYESEVDKVAERITCGLARALNRDDIKASWES
jgi:hypothetical protein